MKPRYNVPPQGSWKGRSPIRAGVLAAAAAAVVERFPNVEPSADAPLPERPNQMSFGEQVVEAMGEYIEAKIDYAEARRGVNAAYASHDTVTKSGERLQALLDKVRFAL